MSDKSCYDCRFFYPLPEKTAQKTWLVDHGECRRFPKVFIEPMFAETDDEDLEGQQREVGSPWPWHWPQMDADGDWCGEYSKADNATAGKLWRQFSEGGIELDSQTEAP